MKKRAAQATIPRRPSLMGDSPLGLERETQASAYATRILYQQDTLAADGAQRQIALRQHIADVRVSFHVAPETGNRLADQNVHARQRLHGIDSIYVAFQRRAAAAHPLISGDDAR